MVIIILIIIEIIIIIIIDIIIIIVIIIIIDIINIIDNIIIIDIAVGRTVVRAPCWMWVADPDTRSVSPWGTICGLLVGISTVNWAWGIINPGTMFARFLFRSQ